MKIRAYSDIFVKYLFGTPGNEDLLLRFINDVLTDAGFEPVVSVEIKNPFNYQEFADDKLSILDVKAVDHRGRQILIEVQSTGSESHKQRILYYWAKAYSDQLEEGNRYTKLKPVISINVLNFDLLKDCSDYHNVFCITKTDDSNLV